MSTLSQFAPFASGGLKTFQTGYLRTNSISTSSGEDDRYVDISISSVSTAKAIPAFMGSWGQNNYNSGQLIFPNTLYSFTGFATIRLISGTTIRLGLAQNRDNLQIGGRWQVAEAN